LSALDAFPPVRSLIAVTALAALATALTLIGCRPSGPGEKPRAPKGGPVSASDLTLYDEPSRWGERRWPEGFGNKPGLYHLWPAGYGTPLAIEPDDAEKGNSELNL
jgi:hypothetical protein